MKWIVVLVVGLLPVLAGAVEGELGFPALTAVNRPWAYWWWMGSAVNERDISREMGLFRDAGMGGVHVIPIYGAKGYEKQGIEYLSPRWFEVLNHSVTEARRLRMDLDMTLGTGWCFGGPGVTERQANAKFVVKQVRVKPGEGVKETLDPAQTQVVLAAPDVGERVELTDKVRADGSLDWVAPAGPAKGWVVYALSQRPSGQKVKRAAPGGQGHMLNPFYGEAIRAYVKRFDEAFAKYQGAKPRAVYHDSYEYQSNWSPDLFAEFEKRRGYRLQAYLPELLDEGSAETSARVKHDYRETVSDLMVESFMPAWVDWAHGRGMIARNESHGSPGNLLDLYAAADVPETEMFSKDRNPLVAKFASSAAHVTGKKLVSAETGTWLAEHFTETLGDVKRLVDEMFVSGVNHVFYHGTCYSPAEVAWPGWVFYASTEMNPRNSIWRDVPALNAYVARCQSILQMGEAESDVLLYWPIHDLWQDPKGLVMPLTVHHTDWLTGQPVGRAAKMMWEKGWAFDYVSDRQLQTAKGAANGVEVGGCRYAAVVVPSCKHMPVATMARLMELAKGGARVVFQDAFPDDVPGLADLENRRRQVREIAASAKLEAVKDERFPNLRSDEASRVFVGDLGSAMKLHFAYGHELPHPDLRIVRRTWEGGRHWFVCNAGTKVIDCVLPVGSAMSVLAMDPMTGRTGLADAATHRGNQDVHLRLEAGQSLILRTFTSEAVTAPRWSDHDEFAGKAVELSGEWKVKFIDGGPALPREFAAEKLGSWTGREDAQAFAGTARYALTFDLPAAVVGQRVQLDLGEVRDSARVRVNGKDVGTLIMAPWRVAVEGLKERGNVLEVEVTNVSGNRVRDLDRRGVKWRNFSDINFVNIDYKPFDASGWAVREAGLMGPVTLRSER